MKERAPKGSLFRHPAVMALGGAALAAVLGLNVVAFVGGDQAPWLLGSVLVADMLLIGVGILVAAREVLVAEKQTETSQAQLASIVDSAMDAIVTIDARQRIVLFNRAAEQVFRCRREDALGTPLERFLPARYRGAHHDHVEQFAQTGVTSRRMGDVTTLWGLRADGEEFPLEASISQTAGAQGDRLFTVILRDVTVRHQAEREAERVRGALSDAQARLGAIVDSAMDAVITIDEEQRIVLFNRTAEQLFGVRREDALGGPLERFLPARFRAAHRSHIARFGETGVTSRRMGDVTTLWALRADGTEFPIEASISQAAEQGRRYFTVILRDITRRKQVEEAMRAHAQELRELSARVLEAREDEKARIARELHDELGQLLTALKMDLSAVLQSAGAELREKLLGMGALLDQTVTSTRRISADLRPLMLDDLGLPDAAQWLVDDFSRRSGIACELAMSGQDALRELDKRLATAVYRAIQESLTNIGRHAGAKNAWAVLSLQDGTLHYEIEDNGRGIGAEDLGKLRSLGLKGMRERIAYFGGALHVERAPRGGTRLRVFVPVRQEKEEDGARTEKAHS